MNQLNRWIDTPGRNHSGISEVYFKRIYLPHGLNQFIVINHGLEVKATSGLQTVLVYGNPK